DKERDSLIISDRWNKRVVRWPCQNGTRGETIISNIACWGLTMDDNGSLYVVDVEKHEVRRYKIGDTQGTVVAGGNGQGNRPDQLSEPHYVFVDRDHSVYVSGYENHRVTKWEEGAKQGIVVAGGQGEGTSLTQLSYPQGVVVDQLGTVYVTDHGNHRIMRWPKGATQGSVIVGGNGYEAQSNQLACPTGLSFDRHGNLYVVDWGNHRNQNGSEYWICVKCQTTATSYLDLSVIVREDHTHLPDETDKGVLELRQILKRKAIEESSPIDRIVQEASSISRLRDNMGAPTSKRRKDKVITDECLIKLCQRYDEGRLDIPSFLKAAGLRYFQRPPKVERPFTFF
ncbi:unnamed protein product, partial [Rotaria sp. Silwood1]